MNGARASDGGDPLQPEMRHSDAFFLGLHGLAPWRLLAWLVPLFLLSFSICASFAPTGLINGDAAPYAQHMQPLNLGDLSIHLGYYLLGAGFIPLSPFPADYSLNLMNCVFAAGCLCMVFLVTHRVVGTTVAAIASALMLMTNVMFVTNAICAEVYVPQLFFFLLSVVLLLHAQAAGAGVALACACLITPSTLLSLPFVVLLYPRWRVVLAWAGSLTVILALVWLPVYRDFLFGTRGLWWAGGQSVNLRWALTKEFGELLHFHVFFVFVLAGVLSLAVNPRYRRFGLALVVLWAAQLAFGEKFRDVPVQLPFYAMLCVVGGVGVQALRERVRGLRPVALLIGALLLFAAGVSGGEAYRRMLALQAEVDSYHETVMAVHSASRPGYVTVGGWSRVTLFQHYVAGRSATGTWINAEWLSGRWGEEFRRKGWGQLRQAFSSRRQIWLLDPPTGSGRTNFQREGYEIAPFRDVHVATYER